MSASNTIKRRTVPDITAMKGVEPIVALTAYSAPMAKILDAHCDVLLVGDSAGMVVYGMESTLGVTLDMMIAHGRAVTRGSKQALIVVDLPFATYESSPENAFAAAARVMAETQASAVKLEGGVHIAETIKFLTDRGIPVMGHVGLTPQAVNTIGGYKVVGRGAEAARIVDDARAIADAGAFSIVLEKIPTSLAKTITASIDIPTIGIGASASCDGQILVVDDMLGIFNEFRPKFVKRYAELANEIDSAVRTYAKEVKQGEFPLDSHSFHD